MHRRRCKFGTFQIFLLLCGFALVLHFSIKYLEVKTKSINSCYYDEPIDIVYTWVNGTDPLFQENINRYMSKQERKVDSSKQRYDDKNELKFSLRSLEKHLPWFNHVYLVTNGQIPHWLNLNYDKVTVITHNQIFKDQSNLPTFSSPAIESNLHRIPGLSKRFIYFNDDIFIGQPLYVDDFYSCTKGQAVFLSYTLPSCASDCPWLYIGDGECDWNCNIERCQFDGGDCEKVERNSASFLDQTISNEEASNNPKSENELGRLKDRGHARLDSTNQTRLKGHNKKNITKKKIYQPVVGFVAKQAANTSISKLVDEHNKNVLKRDKKLKRSKRSVLKQNDNAIPVRTFLGRFPKHIDGYLESLFYTQKLLNKRYGFKSRYVPAHAPLFLDRDVLEGLQNTFRLEFELTERNRFRDQNDVQFGFSYYYFLMSETVHRPVHSIFDEFDTDGTGTWSDREIRNLLTKIYALPLTYDIVDNFEQFLLNCSGLREYPEITTPPYERYVDSRLPTISKEMIVQCPFFSQFLKSKFGSLPKYKFEVVKDSENAYATFKMLISNISNVVIKLDEVRKKLTKFVCLNDNLDELKPDENEMIKAHLYDFYASLFPHPSKFELSDDSRNRFLLMQELIAWRKQHFFVRRILFFSIISLILVTFFHYIKKSCCKIFSGLFC